MELGTEPLRVALPPEPGERLAAHGGRLLLRLEGLQADRPAGMSYELYLNLPQGARPDPEGPCYVANLGFFGRKAEGGTQAGPSQVYDVTAVVRGLEARGLWTGQEPSVTFVPRGLESARTGKSLPLKAGTKARVGRVALVRG